jgi:hypothetical protein
MTADVEIPVTGVPAARRRPSFGYFPWTSKESNPAAGRDRRSSDLVFSRNRFKAKPACRAYLAIALGDGATRQAPYFFPTGNKK